MKRHFLVRDIARNGLIYSIFAIAIPMRDLETTAVYALGIPLVAIVVVVEFAIARHRGVRTFDFAETVSNLTCGLSTLILGMFTGPFVYALYEYGYRTHALIDWNGSWVRFPLALLCAETR